MGNSPSHKCNTLLTCHSLCHALWWLFSHQSGFGVSIGGRICRASRELNGGGAIWLGSIIRPWHRSLGGGFGLGPFRLERNATKGTREVLHNLRLCYGEPCRCAGSPDSINCRVLMDRNHMYGATMKGVCVETICFQIHAYAHPRKLWLAANENTLHSRRVMV